MQISELYRKSKMGEELKEFSNKMLNSKYTVYNDYGETLFKQILCDKKSYSDNDLDVNRGMTYGFSMNAYYGILEFCNKYSESIKYNISPADLVKFSHVLGKNILNIDHNDTKQLEETINNSVDQYTTPILLSEILSCSDFMDVFNDPKSNIKNQLQDLLSKHTEMSYDDIKKAVDSSSLTPENKKIVFAEVLPKYNFKVCSEFASTWDMFENGYIDFDTLVTQFWNRENFDQGQNNENHKHAFQNFASKYKNYTNYQNNDIVSLKSSAEEMIDALHNKGAIGDQAVSDLKDQINNATDVGIFGIIAQFFSNLFSKGKTAFKPIQQTKQDRVISN